MKSVSYRPILIAMTPDARKRYHDYATTAIENVKQMKYPTTTDKYGIAVIPEYLEKLDTFELEHDAIKWLYNRIKYYEKHAKSVSGTHEKKAKAAIVFLRRLRNYHIRHANNAQKRAKKATNVASS